MSNRYGSVLPSVTTVLGDNPCRPSLFAVLSIGGAPYVLRARARVRIRSAWPAPPGLGQSPSDAPAANTHGRSPHQINHGCVLEQSRREKSARGTITTSKRRSTRGAREATGALSAL